MTATMRLRWARWAPILLTLTAILAACSPTVTPELPAPAPAEPQVTCDDSAIRLPDRGAGIHGAIVDDTLHLGGETAPATCMEPANRSLEAGLSMPDDRTAQVRQSQYYLIVIRYPGGNRLYVLSRRSDGTSCVVDTNDQCIALVTDLPDDFDLGDLPDDIAPTIPAGRPAPPTVNPPPGDDSPPAPGPPPGDGAPPPAAGTPPGAASSPQPRDGATGVIGSTLLSWAAAPGALSYDVYYGATKALAADSDKGTPINTSSTSTYLLEVSLAAETLYYWRVDAKNAAGTTRGAVWSFTTAAPGAPPPATGPPGAASSPQPRDGATGVIGSTLLSWAAASGALSYDVYYGTTKALAADSDKGTPINTSSTSTYLLEVSLAAETLYYWRVDAKNAASTTRGAVWSFTTAAAPAAPPAEDPPPAEEPPPVSPPPAPSPPPPRVPDIGAPPGAAGNPQPRDGATGVSVRGPVLSWTAASGNVSIYELWWGATNDLEDIPSDNIITTSRTRESIAASSDLAPETVYYWRVDAHNIWGRTSSEVWSFTTGAAIR